MRKICRRRARRKSRRAGSLLRRNRETNRHNLRKPTAPNDEFGAVAIWSAAASPARPACRWQAQADFRSFCLPPFPSPVIQLVYRHLPAQRIAVNSQKFGGPALIAVGALQNSFDEAFFEFTDGFIKQNSTFHHLSHKTTQLHSHVRTPRTS